MLRDYQISIAEKAAYILRSLGLVYLAMEVRTGKTRTALYTAELVGARSVLFLTKKKAINDISTQGSDLGVSFELMVTNYEALPAIYDSWQHNSRAFDLVICDEAHCLGAFPKPSVRTRLLKDCVRGTKVIYLSGTPTPESWSQIYHQFWISERSPFPERKFYEWAKKYVNIKQKYFFNRQVNDYSDADQSKIEPNIRDYFLSYTQEQAGFTELVEESILWVTMSAATYNFAKRLKIDRVVINNQGDKVIADTEVKLMQKLHQIYTGTVIVDEPQQIRAVFDKTKAERIKEHFAGQKIAIFYKFQAEEQMLRDVFAGHIVPTPEEFNATGSDKIYISQIQSGREGINLSAADALVMINIDFSAVSYFQARARLQSKERQDKARVVWVFAKNGIEERIYDRVQNKKDYTLNHFKTDLKTL